MADKAMYLEIVTPEGTSFREEITACYARTAEGSIGILKNHAPLISPLVAGPVRYVADGKEKTVIVGEGFLRVEYNVVTLLAKTFSAEQE